MIITRLIDAYQASWAFAGRRNSAYIRLGYLQSGLPWPGLRPIGLPTKGLARWEHCRELKGKGKKLETPQGR